MRGENLQVARFDGDCFVRCVDKHGPASIASLRPTHTSELAVQRCRTQAHQDDVGALRQ